MNQHFFITCKYLVDPIIAFLILLSISPLLAIIAMGVAIDLGNPVIFSQPRGGYLGKQFEILKFRTMRNNTDADGSPLADKERLTQFGNFLRKSSLDELPELVNILRGEMTFIGPRPFIAKYLNLYTPEQARRHEVKPGITGWAQVNGRNAISWEEKFKLDVWYVDHVSLWLDIKILFLTVWKVFKRDGISQEGNATMEEFTGS
jgi:lipopolysaccharide/colanic/teichoic acid biosynthesis glycosyltransferase